MGQFLPETWAFGASPMKGGKVMALTLTRQPSRFHDVALVAAEGAIDLAHAGALDTLFDELRRGGDIHVVLDIAKVRYVSSTGFATLVKHAQALDALGGSVSLLGVPPKVRIVA